MSSPAQIAEDQDGHLESPAGLESEPLAAATPKGNSRGKYISKAW